MNVSRIYRLLKLVTMLQSGKGYTAAELAIELEVSRRTVFRDLNMLELAHIPYYFDEQAQSYRINQHFFLPPVNLTLPEALSMLLLTGRLRTRQLPLMSHSSRAALKLESALPASIREHVGSLLDRVNVSMSPVSRHEGLDDLFEQLAGAVREKRICRLVYLSFHEQRQLVTFIHPLRLTFHARAWYLIAYSAQHKEARTFKLGRIRKLTVTDRTFSWPCDVKVEEHFGNAWSMIPEGKLYDVNLRFDRKVAGNVAEVQWHPSQQVSWRDDGGLDFKVRVDGLGEISWWILGYGDQVEVQTPALLRRKIAGMARSLVARYAQEGAE